MRRTSVDDAGHDDTPEEEPRWVIATIKNAGLPDVSIITTQQRTRNERLIIGRWLLIGQKGDQPTEAPKSQPNNGQGTRGLIILETVHHDPQAQQ